MNERPIFYFPRMLPFNYRVAVLERLNERLGGRLVVCSGQAPEATALQSITDEEQRGYRIIQLRNLWWGGEKIHAQFFGRAFREGGMPSVIMAEESPRTLTQPWLLRHARRHGIGRVLWGHFSSNNRPFSPDNWADRYRIRLARQAEAVVSYTEEMADLLRPFIPAKRLFVARNTLDTDTLFALYDQLAAAGKVAVRRRLGLPENLPVLVFIGRLIPEKGTDLLLDVFSALRARRPAHLLIIGDGPEHTAMERRVTEEKIENVLFLGAMKAWEASAPYLFAADVMFQPGYLGLSVNHAFAFGVPVVSQAPPPDGRRFHSPEVAFVEPGQNGMLAEYGNLDALLKALELVLDQQERFAHHALITARSRLTLDQMVDGLEAAIRFAEDPVHHLSH